MQGVFVTGTDTNVGKTAVAAAFMHRYRYTGTLCYWKPIQTGIEQDDDTAAVRKLGECVDGEILDVGVRLPRPLSPHLAARLKGESIELKQLLQLLPANQSEKRWVIEGAGGVLVPINERHLMIDLIEQLALPVIVAACSGLGTINHTLLTLEALGRRGLRTAGVVMVGAANHDNREAIEQYGAVPVLGEMPCFESLTSAALKSWAQAELDPHSLLKESFNG
jgi:dethiobiotin synthetase